MTHVRCFQSSTSAGSRNGCRALSPQQFGLHSFFTSEAATGKSLACLPALGRGGNDVEKISENVNDLGAAYRHFSSFRRRSSNETRFAMSRPLPCHPEGLGCAVLCLSRLQDRAEEPEGIAGARLLELVMA